MSYHLAPALAVLRDEINARWPGRDRRSDGWIGDVAHQASRSDHNPNDRGSVNALDVDKDGVDIAEIIAAVQRHPSTHYWIWNRQIADRDDGFRRRPYSGPNPHTEHLHISIRQTRQAEQDTRPWGLEDTVTPADLLNAKVHNPITGKDATVAAFLQSINSEAYKGRLTAEANLAATKGIDTQAILARIEQVAAEERQRDTDLAELIRQHQAGELDAAEVVRLIGERLLTTPQG